MLYKSIIYLGLFFNETLYNFPMYSGRVLFSSIGYIIFLLLFLRVLYNFFVKKSYNLKGIFVIICSLFLLKNELLKVNLAVTFTLYFLISLSDTQKIQTYLALYKILSILSFGGLVIFICLYFYPNFIEGVILEGPNPLKAYYGVFYKEYILTSLLIKNNIFIYRFQGIFGEPGLLGSVIGMIFLFDFDYEKLKKERIILLISGIMTLSAAFYVFILLKIVFLVKSKKMKIGLVVLNLFLGMFLFSKYEELFNKTYGRIINIENNNREDIETKKILNKFMFTSESIFGTGEKFSVRYPYLDNSSWRLIVYESGYVHLFLMILFIFYLTNFFEQQNKIKISIILFILSLYQRPEIFNILNLIILICGTQYAQMDKLSIKYFDEL